ncbi:hypothetical protein LY76DRAFT_595720 [Colletotrichum caudatum]|nr:hypothetical protein LY76DRAFT_595720 [Colletotrichum caudatum]
MGRTFLGCPLVSHTGTRPPLLPSLLPLSRFWPGGSRYDNAVLGFRLRSPDNPRFSGHFFFFLLLLCLTPGPDFCQGAVSRPFRPMFLRVPTGLAPRKDSRAFVLGRASLLTCGVLPKSPGSRGASPVPEAPPP